MAHGNPALALSAAHLPGATGTGTVGPVTLDVSYDDGAHWQNEALSRRTDGTWRVTLHAPHGTHYVSIRACAADSAGNSVSETVIRAFGVS